jgi:hypothetical protein
VQHDASAKVCLSSEASHPNNNEVSPKLNNLGMGTQLDLVMHNNVELCVFQQNYLLEFIAWKG